MAYADDINIIARSLDRANEILINLDEAAKEVGLRINKDKTKTMTQTSCWVPRKQNIIIGNYNFEKVERFTYLRTDVMNDASETEEIKRRLHQANKVYYSVLPIVKSRQVHRKTKIHI